MSETNGTEARAAAEHQRGLDEQTAADRQRVTEAESRARAQHEPVQQPTHEPTPVEAEIANTPAAKMDGKEAHARLREKGITIARVTAPDLLGIEAKRKDEAAAVALQPAHRPRQFPNLTAGEMVAVDRFGDVHQLDPERPDALAFHKQMEEAEPLPSVTQAHAEYEAIYKPTDAGRRRADVRKSLVGIKEAMAGPGRNVVQMASDAVAALAGLVHDQMPDDEPEDCLRAALRALAGGRTVDAMTEMEKAEGLLVRDVPLSDTLDAPPPPRNPVLDEITAAEEALAAGDRAACMKMLHAIVPKLEPTKHRVVIEDPKAPLPPL